MYDARKEEIYSVTILILIDGFLQFMRNAKSPQTPLCHNPYFNRWFSAMGTATKRR